MTCFILLDNHSGEVARSGWLSDEENIFQVLWGRKKKTINTNIIKWILQSMVF